MTRDLFQLSPLITPKDLEADPEAASHHLPPGVIGAWPTADDSTGKASEYGATTWAVDGSDPQAFLLDTTFAAILNEASRFKGALRTHSNRSPGDPTATHYLRFLSSDSDPKSGSFTVARIVVDAKTREVAYSKENPRDLRRASLSADGRRRGKARRNARDDLMNHAIQSAAEFAPPGFNKHEYVSNLAALLAYYDRQEGTLRDYDDSEEPI
jgi:hypothetical protein